MTEPIGGHRDAITDPLHREVLHFLLDEIRRVYPLPTGSHDLHLLETGVIDDDEFFRRMVQRHAETGAATVDAQTAASILFGPGMVACMVMVEAVRRVRSAGYRTALLTNISRSGEAIWASLLPVHELFDVVVDSSQVGLRKPDPAIFRLTCERLRVAPSRCLFVDDLRCNVEAAAALGMTTIQCHDPVAIAAEVARVLLDEHALAQPEVGAGRPV